MLDILAKNGWICTKEIVDGPVVSNRLEKNECVIIAEREYYPPDEIETYIYIIEGELDIHDEVCFEDLDWEIVY